MPTFTISSRFFRHSSRPASPVRSLLSLAAPFALAAAMAAQGIDSSSLLKPSKDSWPTYHGDYTGRRNSPLIQITPDNVKNLGLAWAFQTGRTDQIKASPIVVDGVMYVSTPDHVWAIDARTGRQLWTYANPENKAFHIGHRGVAVYKNLVYLTTPDCYLVALNAADGAVKWRIKIADSSKGYWSTNAPLLVKNHLLVGVSGDFDNLPGLLQSFDP